jgi:SPP1 family holin
MKISKGTIVRTIGIILVLVNMILQRMGCDIINVSENEILVFVETLIEIAIIVVGFWKNNSYSENAIKADAFLQTLRNDTEESEG